MTSKPGARGPNWISGEDQALAKAWLAVSRDSIVGTDQSGPAFWERVTAKYNETRPRIHARFERPQNAVANRWKCIRLAVGKFCDCIAAVERLNQSGKNDEDRIQDAVSMYEVEQNEQFDFLDAWRELRQEPKWRALPDARSCRKRGSNHLNEQPEMQTGKENTTFSHSCNEERPVGVKKQKAARSQEMSSQQLVDAALEISRSSKRKAELEEQRLFILGEREQNRIIFASLEGLDEISARILKIKKEKILKQLLNEDGLSCR